jgi:hypothetical protein
MFGLDWQARQRRTGAASPESAGQHTCKRRDIPRCITTCKCSRCD